MCSDAESNRWWKAKLKIAWCRDGRRVVAYRSNLLRDSHVRVRISTADGDDSNGDSKRGSAGPGFRKRTGYTLRGQNLWFPD